MKIAILSLHTNTANYGCIMQRYALQTVLKRMGNEVYSLNIEDLNYGKISKIRFCLSIAKRFLMKFVLKKNVQI